MHTDDYMQKQIKGLFTTESRLVLITGFNAVCSNDDPSYNGYLWIVLCYYFIYSVHMCSISMILWKIKHTTTLHHLCSMHI